LIVGTGAADSVASIAAATVIAAVVGRGVRVRRAGSVLV
jgi:hypothetical protein